MGAKSSYILGPILPCLVLAGCTGQSITPDAASILVPKSPRSIPVTVGIVQAEQTPMQVITFLGDEKRGKTSAKQADGFKECLETSELFEHVSYPPRPTDQFDATLALRVDSQLRLDPSAPLKGAFTGFMWFLNEPFVLYRHKYQSQCALGLMRGNQLLKTYTAESSVVVSHKLFFSAERLSEDCVAAAEKLLWASLVEQLSNDRAFLEANLAINPMTRQQNASPYEQQSSAASSPGATGILPVR